MLMLFAGYDRSGKDSAYTAIKEMESELPFESVARVALADHLKDVALKTFGVTESMKGTGAEEYYRMVLTKLSEVMKIAAGSDTYFAQYLVNSVGPENLYSKNKLYVCTDGRYRYEIQHLRACSPHAYGFAAFKVTRPNTPPTKYAVENHNFSDYEMFLFNLDNDGTLEQYKARVQKAVITALDSQKGW